MVRSYAKSDAKKASDKEFPKTIKYNKNIGAYSLAQNEEEVFKKLLTQDEFDKYLQGEVTHIFPKYDEHSHKIITDYYQHYNKTILTVYEQKKEDELTLPYGMYKINYNHDEGVTFRELNSNLNEYVDLGRNDFSIYEDFISWRKTKLRYKSKKKIHKRGTLIFGDPGNGKTREILKLFENAKNEKFYVLFVPTSFSDLSCLTEYRDIFKDKEVVFIFEELTERNTHSVENLLSFMDGETSWDNCYVIATTNYPEELSYNLVDRPGRFKNVREFKNPTKEQRMLFLKNSGIESTNIEQAATFMEGLSLDYICSIVNDVVIEDKNILDVIKQEKEKRVLSKQKFKAPIGFDKE